MSRFSISVKEGLARRGNESNLYSIRALYFYNLPNEFVEDVCELATNFASKCNYEVVPIFDEGRFILTFVNLAKETSKKFDKRIKEFIKKELQAKAYGGF